MEAVQLISLYSTLFYASMALCILGFVLALVFFFAFDIRKVYTMITGRGKEKLMQRSSKEKSRDLSKRGSSAPVRSSELYSGGITGGIAPPAQSGQTPTSQTESDETVPMGRGKRRAEAEQTSVLHGASADEAATSVLPQNGAASDLGVTSFLTPQAPIGTFDVFESVVEIHTDELI